MIHIICKDTELYDKSKLRIFFKNTYKVYMITPHAHLENKNKKRKLKTFQLLTDI